MGVKRFSKDYFLKRGKTFPIIKGLIAALFIKAFLRPKTLLDVGCALGELVWFTSRLGIKSKGVDISSEAISQLNSSLKPSCKVGSILNLPFPDKRFDVISCLALLEHIPAKKAKKALKELLRVSRKYVLLQICVKDNPLEGNHYLLDPTHVNVRQNRWWIEKFNDLGLKFKTISRTGVFLLLKDL